MQEKSNINQSMRLIIRISRNSLSFATVNGEGDGDGHVIYVPYFLNSGISMAANLREAFRSEAILKESYARVLVMVDSPVLMVPIEQFHEEEQRTLYLYTFQGHEQDEMAHTVLPDLNCVAVFCINRDLKLVIEDHFQQPTFIAAIAPVWRYLHQRSYMGVRGKLYAYFHDNRMEVFGYGQNRFRFCNTFDAKDVHDALYFLLYVWKQLNLQPEHDELHLVGDIPERAFLMEELKQYLQNAYVINPPAAFTRAPPPQFSAMPFDLMTILTKGR